jgi:hypothetical protein
MATVLLTNERDADYVICCRSRVPLLASLRTVALNAAPAKGALPGLRRSALTARTRTDRPGTTCLELSRATRTSYTEPSATTAATPTISTAQSEQQSTNSKPYI